ncbi:hypothetical protein ACQPZX_44890 [Actinoplanes sp. CA-142083]|uniref:hypothetical protein n=1 Tax=Actinoplanes sp. CA-142083 TaxID=3239903 RepID=UPI003D932D5D
MALAVSLLIVVVAASVPLLLANRSDDSARRLVLRIVRIAPSRRAAPAGRSGLEPVDRVPPTQVVIETTTRQGERPESTAIDPAPVARIRIDTAPDTSPRPRTPAAGRPASKAVRPPKQRSAPPAPDPASPSDRMTVVVFVPPHAAGTLRRRVVGVIGDVTFVKSNRLVIGPRSHVEHRVSYRFKRLRLSAKPLSRLARSARRAFLDVLRDPNNAAANARFRRALPQRKRIPRKDCLIRFPTERRVQISTRDCSNARVGPGHRVVVRHNYRVRDHSLDVREVLRDNKEAVRQMALFLRYSLATRELARHVTENLGTESLGDVEAQGVTPSMTSVRRGAIEVADADGSVVGSRVSVSALVQVEASKAEFSGFDEIRLPGPFVADRNGTPHTSTSVADHSFGL